MRRGRPFVTAEHAAAAAAAEPAAPRQQVGAQLAALTAQRLVRHSAGAGGAEVSVLLPRSWSVAY